MPKSKRSGRRAENIIASHAMQHHDFVGGADAERKEAEKQKEARVQHDHQTLEKGVVREMARELEAQAGVAGADSAERPPAAEHGLFGALRTKAEERLQALPRPVKRAIHRGEQAAALLLAPARIGVALARELFKAPWRLFQAFRRHAA
jgi:hypothetical protein